MLRRAIRQTRFGAAPVAAVGGLLCLAALLPWAAPSFGCSCVDQGQFGGFVDPGGRGLPADAVGLPWRGSLPAPEGDEFRAGDYFAIEELTADGVVEHEVEARLLAGTPFGERTGPGSEWVGTEPILVAPDVEDGVVEIGGESIQIRQRWSDRTSIYGVWLVSPRSGFRPGSFYSFSLRPRRLSRGDDLTIRISKDELPRLGEVELRTEEPKWAQLVVGVPISCSFGVRSRSVELKLDLPEEVDSFSKSIFYTTLVNGEVWKPSTNFCWPPEPGESWRGRGVDEVFLPCGVSGFGLDEEIYRRQPGRYEVELIAWLPGRFEVGRGRAIVELSCDDP